MPTKRRKSKKIKVVEKRLGRSRAVGLAYQGENLIEIDPNQNSKDYVNTIIHEFAHLKEESWSESKVLKFADELTDLLWDLNVRRIMK